MNIDTFLRVPADIRVFGDEDEGFEVLLPEGAIINARSKAEVAAAILGFCGVENLNGKTEAVYVVVDMVGGRKRRIGFHGLATDPFEIQPDLTQPDVKRVFDEATESRSRFLTREEALGPSATATS